MKVIFEIPTEDFSAIQFHSAEDSAIKGKCVVCPHCANCNIPENPTNGDMLKAMFPKYYQGILSYLENSKWWNSPYKKEV